ncbi:VCBS repeat-containing protein [Sinorhizobium sp. 7-81]|uniref:FG-GAP repeat domain-containing protein n=1 Tax=Sinorhizobium sp. 8-89 TaxID=3049089 RepID=UPI0024C431C2|nr:VCBS repeat-containing protein [Sinorhizobium sp. 8-89]MDK1493724.1 VCBS repeat-containing protein [Sinorhizobium sp. 8-89]
MSVKRWEDDATVWHGPDYGSEALQYHPDVKSAAVAGRIITCVEVVDWSGTGTRDLLLSAWDPCYDGRVFLRRQIGTNEDGSPILGKEELVEGVRGYVTAVRDGDVFHLVSASRMRKQIYIFPNVGSKGDPEFADPVRLDLDADWVKGNEYFHMARFHDIDGDGVPELIVGSDYWDDYWPNGLEWNDEGYRGYDDAGRWLGGPLRGFLYVFKNKGTLASPSLERGKALVSGETPLEVYGQLAPAFGRFGSDSQTVIAGEFWNILHIARQHEDGTFAPTSLIAAVNDEVLELDQCIHLPCVVDWDGDGLEDILVGAEDGYVTFLKNVGISEDGLPRFEKRGRVETTKPLIHAGVLPSPAAHDFSGDGHFDLVVGNSTGELLFYASREENGMIYLDKEVMLEADGKPVRLAAGLTGSIQGPSEKMFGYSCPTLANWTGSGHMDILVSDVTGRHRLFRNTGEKTIPPRFGAEEFLTYKGKPLKTVWRVRPAVVDWEKNGQLHYVALDEDGVLSDWKKASDTELVEKHFLRWENGDEMRFTVDVGGGRGRVKLCFCDWEGTGRTDLIFGTHARACVPPDPQTGAPRNTTKQAGLFLSRNVGTPEEPRFALPIPFKFRDETIAMAMHVASPEAVDWAGRGALDLVVGVEDGSIVWLKREELSW